MDTFNTLVTGFWGGFVAGGLVVGFWSSKIWPWIKSETTKVETKAAADAKSAASTVANDVAKKV